MICKLDLMESERMNMSRKAHAFTALSLLTLAATLAGCGGGSSDSGTVPTGNADFAISVTPTSSTITVGGIRLFSAVARDANGNVVPGISFSWHSSDTNIAVSKGGGQFQGVAAGTVTVTASATSTSNSGNTFTTVTSNAATLAVSADAAGTAAEGAPIVGGVVSLVDKNGQVAAGGSDAAGHFDIPVAGLTGPFLLKVEDPQGETLYGVSPGPGAAFTRRAPLPAADEVKALDRFIVQTLSGVLEEQGLDAGRFSFLSTPFAADHTGFDRILDHTRLDPARGSLGVETAQGTVTGAITLDKANATLHWTLTHGSLSVHASLTLPDPR